MLDQFGIEERTGIGRIFDKLHSDEFFEAHPLLATLIRK